MKAAALVFAGIVVLVIIVGVVSSVHKATVHSTTLADSKEALELKQSLIEQDAQEELDEVSQKLGLSSAMYVALFDTCYTDHNDSGWTIKSYNYKCMLSKLAFYEVSNDSDLMHVIDAYAVEKSSGDSEFEKVYYGDVYYLNLYAHKAHNPFFDIDGLSYNDLPVVHANTYKNVEEVLAVEATTDAMRIVPYAQADAFANRRVIQENGSKTLDTQKTYVILQTSDYYFVEDIGCAIPEIIVCESPL